MTCSLVFAVVVPSSSPRSGSTRTSIGCATCAAPRASSSGWPSRSADRFVARHRFHGDPDRFDVVADFVAARFPDARTAADVAGGQGMLARCLSKRHNIECDVIDPRGWVLRGVSSRPEEYVSTMA